MKLNIQNEFGELTSVVVVRGDRIPRFEDYQTDDPEFMKYHGSPWDKDKLLLQQDTFFKLLESYGVELIFPKMSDDLIWQMYTRDTGFVVGKKLFYSSTRKMEARNGEIENLLEILNLDADQIVSLDDEIEGGDVLVVGEDELYLGLSSRTSSESVTALNTIGLKIRTFKLGDKVMHLDTRFTILSEKLALVNPGAFADYDLEFLSKRYELIEVSDAETDALGTNVFMINPETVIVPTQHSRIGGELEGKGMKVEYVDYSEPINLGGSFRCTTMPLERI